MRSGLRGKMRQRFFLCLSTHADVQGHILCLKNVAAKNVIWRRFTNIVNGGTEEMMIYVNYLTTIVN